MKTSYPKHLAILGLLAYTLHGSCFSVEAPGQQLPAELQRWMVPQSWTRDTDGPIVELGTPGSFDDTHIFAPCVAEEHGRFSLWYCGSTGSVARRVFAMGLATSDDGRRFRKQEDNPVFEFGDERHSILTPALLRDARGRVLRENGRLRMWFSSTDFSGKTGLHTLHETFSEDGVQWLRPSGPLLRDVYAPTIFKEGTAYKMWYTDVSADPWVFRYAESPDGRQWRVHGEPVLGLDQDWESGRLFYPTVVKAEDVYLMWYGSYWRQQRSKTALGFAVSLDGRKWHKNPHNPVFTPDPSRPWESHYTTSQSVLPLADGGWRIWYASRKKPSFVNKYFAIGTATWDGIVLLDE